MRAARELVHTPTRNMLLVTHLHTSKRLSGISSIDARSQHMLTFTEERKFSLGLLFGCHCVHMQVDDWHRVVPVDKAKQFVETRPGNFMHPQASARILSTFSDASEDAAAVAGLRGCAVVLIGDAAHCSPPGASFIPC